MKNNNLLLLALVLTLGGFAYWYIQRDKKSNLDGYDFQFAVKDTASIYKIFMADRSGKTVTLTRQNASAWQVNGKHKVRPDAINNLLDVMARVDLKYRLPRNAVANVVKDVAANGIKVEIYNRSGDKLKSYYVGGVNMDETGTNMMMEEANEPYVTYIPGLVGGLRVSYFLDELDWRDRMIFSYSPEDIQSVSIDYPLQKSNAFKLTKSGNGYTVEPFYPVTPKMNAPVVRALAENYLLGFRKLGAEGFETGFIRADSIKTTVPFAKISLNTEGVAKSLTLYPMLPHNPDGTLIKSVEGQVTVERYYAETETGDWLLIQHQLFEKIFWGYRSFFGVKQ
jgi:hypothetical protein